MDPTLLKRRAVAGSALLTLLLPTAWAVQATRDDDTSAAQLAMLPLEQLMQTRVTAASRFEQLVSEAPSAAVVLTAADIREFGWRTLADALASLPGLYVTNDRNYSYLGARGFLRPGDYNSRFLLMVDGVRTNDAVYDEALLGNGGLLDIDMVKRIEFIPGPGSAVYGSNALFGVINLVTRGGSGLSGPRAAVGAGSFGERKLRASYGWHDQGGADLLFAASAYRRRGEDMYFAEFDNPGQNHGVAHDLDYESAQNLFVKASLGGLTLSAARVERRKGVPTASFGAVFNAPDYTVDMLTSAGLAYQRALAPAASLAVQLDWGHEEYLGYGTYPSDAGPPSANVDGAHGRWYGANASLTLTGLRRQTLVLGAEAGRDARRDQYNFNVAPYELLLDDHRSGNRHALFVEDEIRLPAGFLLNAGLRYDRHISGFGSTSPRVALLYKFSEKDSVKLIAGSAFREPNAYELYYADPGPGGSVASPDLAPERIRAREAVFEHALPGGRARLSLFRYEVRNLISQQPEPLTGMLVFRNLEQARMHGAEASVERTFAGGARLRASYSWQRADDNAGEMVDAPRQLARLNLVAPLFGERARLGTEVLCSSKRLTDNGSAAGYCVPNLTLTVPLAAQAAELSFSLYNASGKRYADPAGPAFRQQAIARQGRTAYVKLSYGF